MDLGNLIKQFWNDIYPEDVIYLNTYRFERSKRFPGVGTKIFTNWEAHKRWRLQELKRVQRNEHNKGVLERFRVEKPPVSPS